MTALARDSALSFVPSHDVLQRAHHPLAQGFISNNRGIDEDKDLPSEMLPAIYKNAKSREIKNDMIMCESENALSTAPELLAGLIRCGARDDTGARGGEATLNFSDACLRPGRHAFVLPMAQVLVCALA